MHFSFVKPLRDTSLPTGSYLKEFCIIILIVMIKLSPPVDLVHSCLQPSKLATLNVCIYIRNGVLFPGLASYCTKRCLAYYFYCPDMPWVTDCKNNWSWKVPAEVNSKQKTNGGRVHTDTRSQRTPKKWTYWCCLWIWTSMSFFGISQNSSLFWNTPKMKHFEHCWLLLKVEGDDSSLMTTSKEANLYFSEKLNKKLHG